MLDVKAWAVTIALKIWLSIIIDPGWLNAVRNRHAKVSRNFVYPQKTRNALSTYEYSSVQ